MTESNGSGDFDFDEPEPEPTQDELFPAGTVPGDGKTIKTIIRAGLPIEVTTSVRSAEVPTPRGGLLDPDTEGKLLLSYELVKYEPTPKRDGEPGAKKIVGWKIRQVLRPTFVARMESDIEGLEAAFAVLLSDDPAGAAGLIDRMRVAVEAELQRVG